MSNKINKIPTNKLINKTKLGAFDFDVHISSSRNIMIFGLEKRKYITNYENDIYYKLLTIFQDLHALYVCTGWLRMKDKYKMAGKHSK